MNERIAYEKIEELICYIKHGEFVEKIKDLLEENIRENYHLKDNFKFHDCLDSYFYITRLNNGDYYLDTTGKKGYERFLNEPNAIQLERKTKNLFPTYEILLKKEVA